MLLKSGIAVNEINHTPGTVVTLEGTGIFLGILVSGSILLGFGFKIISNINRISLSIIQIEKDLKDFADNAEKIRKVESRLDLHIQEYVNRKDVQQMIMGQLDQKIDHKFKRLLFYTRDMQRFLNKDTAFQIREYEETTGQE